MPLFYPRRSMEPLRGRRAGVLAALLVLGVALAACDRSSAGTSATHAQPTPTASGGSPGGSPGATTALPQLTPEPGWYAAAMLNGATAGTGGTDTSEGGFTATKPYSIFAACQGSGTLALTYAQARQTLSCAASAQLFSARNLAPSPVGQQVTVRVTTVGAITWEVLVEMLG